MYNMHPTSNHQFKSRIVHIIIEILRCVFCQTTCVPVTSDALGDI